jgi:2-succinyl-5-enolpyruvyl-6-hydroxy-3-cyclohexene-1-carboxylate synthase
MPSLPIYGNSHIFLLAQLMKDYDLQHAVICPGSRNTPLIRAFHEQEGISTYVIPDERSAAYFALGICQQHQKAVAIICTSGTAAINLGPAMAEAWHQGLPLLAITADRPEEWIGQNDGQTITQQRLFHPFVGLEAQLPVAVNTQAELWHLERICRDLFSTMKYSRKPVHLNVPLREPLQSMDRNGLQELRASRLEPANCRGRVEVPEESSLFRRILILVGMRAADDDFQKAISLLAASGQAVVLTETLSNIDGEEFICSPDGLLHALRIRHCERYNPDLIISFGDMHVSKPMKQWVRSQAHCQHWLITEKDQIPDTFQHIDRVFRCDAADFLLALAEAGITPDSGFVQEWHNANKSFEMKGLDFASKAEWSDLKVFRTIASALPPEGVLQLGNSSVVRYAQLFPWPSGLRFYGNRGTSGIDGAASTALGMASQINSPLTFISGDVSFLYDSNALWNNYKGSNLRIILINNRGGNIFDLIAGPGESHIPTEYLRSYVEVNIAALCNAFGLKHLEARDQDSLNLGLTTLFSDEGPALLEVCTDPDVNARVWKDYFTTMKNLI